MPRTRNVSVLHDMVSCYRPEFFGASAFSRNQRWIVGYRDVDGRGRGDAGRVVLIDVQADAVVARAPNVVRPVSAGVADDGSFAVLDLGTGEALASDVCVYDGRAKVVYRRHIQAIAATVGLSACGQFVAWQTFANPAGDDGDRLAVADVRTGQDLWACHPLTSWALGYDFEVTQGKLLALRVRLRDNHWYRYGHDGAFLDFDAYATNRLKSDRWGDVLFAVFDILNNQPDEAAVRVALAGIGRALSLGADKDLGTLAQAESARGEAYERLGDLHAAMAAYQRALGANPKVGVKKRLAALRQRIANAVV